MKGGCTFRSRLNLPDGKLAAIAGVHTFGDYLTRFYSTENQPMRYFRVRRN